MTVSSVRCRTSFQPPASVARRPSGDGSVRDRPAPGPVGRANAIHAGPAAARPRGLASPRGRRRSHRPSRPSERLLAVAGPRAPRVVWDYAGDDRVVAHIDVVPKLIAGTGFLFAPAVIALADGCAAVGCGANI